MNKINENIIVDKLNKLFRDKELIILTGSYLCQNSYNEKSDIDVIIIDSLLNYPYTEKISIEGVYYEFIFLPLNNFEKILKKDILSSQGIIINMLMYGKIVKDDLNLYENILAYISYLQKALYPKLTENEINGVLIKLQTYIQDLENKNLDQLTQISLINDIIMCFTKLQVDAVNSYLGKGKNKFLNFKNILPETYDQLNNIVQDSCKNGDFGPLINFINKNISPHKLKEEFSQRPLQMQLDKINYLTINIPVTIIKNSIPNSLTSLKKYFELKYYSITDKNITVLIKSDENESYSSILKIIVEIFMIKKINASKIKIISNEWGKFDFYKKHPNIANYCIENISFSESENIIFGINFFRYLLNKKISKQNHDIVVNFMFNLWFPTSYDKEQYYDIFTLKDKRQFEITKYRKYIENHEHYINSQENIFKENIKNISKYFNNYADEILTNSFNYYLLPKTISNEIANSIIILEQFLSEIFSMTNLYNQKPFIAYFFKRLIDNERRQ